MTARTDHILPTTLQTQNSTSLFRTDSLQHSLRSATDLLKRAQLHQERLLNRPPSSTQHSTPLNEDLPSHFPPQVKQADTHPGPQTVQHNVDNVPKVVADSTAPHKDTESSILQASLKEFRKQFKLSRSVDDQSTSDSHESQDAPRKRNMTRETARLSRKIPTDIAPPASRTHTHFSETSNQSASTFDSQKIDEQLNLLDRFQDKLHALNSKFISYQRNMMEEQSNSVQEQTMKQIKYMQRLHEAQTDWQVSHITKLKPFESETTMSTAQHLPKKPSTSDEPVESSSYGNRMNRMDPTIPPSTREMSILEDMRNQLSTLHREFQHFIQGINSSRSPPKNAAEQKQKSVLTQDAEIPVEHTTNYASDKASMVLERIEDTLQDFTEMKTRMGWSPLDEIIRTRSVAPLDGQELRVTDLPADHTVDMSSLAKDQISQINDSLTSERVRAYTRARDTFLEKAVNPPLDYQSVSRLLDEIRRETEQVLDSDVEAIISSSMFSDVQRPLMFFSHSGEGDLPEQFDLQRVKAIVEKKMLEVTYERTAVGSNHNIADMVKPAPPSSAHNNAVMQKAIGAPYLPSSSRTTSILQQANHSRWPKQRTAGFEVESDHKVQWAEIRKRTRKTHENARPNWHRVARPPEAPSPSPATFVPPDRQIHSATQPPQKEAHRPTSPQRPPNFYNVRLSNAPVFLRRTSIRPPSLQSLAKPREKKPPAILTSPTKQRQQSKKENSKPVRQLLKQLPSGAQVNPSRLPTPEKQELLAFDEAVQTSPTTVQQATQVTPQEPYGSEDWSGAIDAVEKTVHVPAMEEDGVEDVEVEPRVASDVAHMNLRKDIGIQYLSPPEDASAQYSCPDDTSTLSAPVQLRRPPPEETRQALRRIVREELANKKRELLQAESSTDSARISTFEERLAKWVQAEVFVKTLPQKQSKPAAVEEAQRLAAPPPAVRSLEEAANSLAERVIEEVIKGETQKLVLSAILESSGSATSLKDRPTDEMKADKKHNEHADQAQPQWAILEEIRLLRREADEDRKKRIREEEEEWKKVQEERIRSLEEQLRQAFTDAERSLLEQNIAQRTNTIGTNDRRETLIEEQQDPAEHVARAERLRQEQREEDARRKREMEEEAERIKRQVGEEARHVRDRLEEEARKKRDLEEEARLRERQNLEQEDARRRQAREVEEARRDEERRRALEMEVERARLEMEKLAWSSFREEEERRLRASTQGVKEGPSKVGHDAGYEALHAEHSRILDESPKRDKVELQEEIERRRKTDLEEAERRRIFELEEVERRSRLDLEEAERRHKLDMEEAMRRYKLELEEAQGKMRMEELESTSYAKDGHDQQKSMVKGEAGVQTDLQVDTWDVRQDHVGVQVNEPTLKPLDTAHEPQKTTSQMPADEADAVETAPTGSSGLTSSIGLTTLSTMMSEGEVLTNIYSEGEIVPPIPRKLLRRALGLSSDISSELSSLSFVYASRSHDRMERFRELPPQQRDISSGETSRSGTGLHVGQAISPGSGIEHHRQAAPKQPVKHVVARRESSPGQAKRSPPLTSVEFQQAAKDDEDSEGEIIGARDPEGQLHAAKWISFANEKHNVPHFGEEHKPKTQMSELGDAGMRLTGRSLDQDASTISNDRHENGSRPQTRRGRDGQDPINSFVFASNPSAPRTPLAADAVMDDAGSFVGSVSTVSPHSAATFSPPSYPNISHNNL